MISHAAGERSRTWHLQVHIRKNDAYGSLVTSYGLPEVFNIAIHKSHRGEDITRLVRDSVECWEHFSITLPKSLHVLPHSSRGFSERREIESWIALYCLEELAQYDAQAVELVLQRADSGLLLLDAPDYLI